MSAEKTTAERSAPDRAGQEAEEIFADDAPLKTDEERLQEDIPWGVRIAAEWSWRAIVMLIFAGVLIWLLSYVSLLLIPLMVAALLATLLKPLHSLLRRIRIPEVLSAVTTILLFLTFVFGVLWLVGQEIVQGFADMADQVTEGAIELVNMADDVAQGLGIDISPEEFQSWLREAQSFISENSDAIMGGAMAVGSVAGNLTIGGILALFTLIFFLADGRRIWDFAVNFVPRKHRPAIHGAGRKGWRALGTYMRVQVFVAAVDAVGIALGAFILGVPLWFPIGVLVFLASFIPIVGAVATGIIAVLLALVANGPVNALLMLGVVLLVQQIESNVLQPIVMGKAVKLHPLAVVLAVTAGSSLLGIVGALFAVPVLAFVNRATQYIAKEEWRNDDLALQMEREQKEALVLQEAARQQQEAEDEEALTALKRRIKESVPGLDPDKPAFSRRGGVSGADRSPMAEGPLEQELDPQQKADLPSGVTGAEAAASQARSKLEEREDAQQEEKDKHDR